MPLKQQLAEHYRAAATRGRTLLAEATTPWLKERIGAEIGRCDRIVEEIEMASEPGRGEPATGRHDPICSSSEEGSDGNGTA